MQVGVLFLFIPLFDLLAYLLAVWRRNLEFSCDTIPLLMINWF